MKAPLILHIESSSTNCSVSLSEGKNLIGFTEQNGSYSHAENLHVFIKDLLQQYQLKPNQLNAIAVSKGPGSYTGLRIGVSAAKGLAYSLNLPLIAVDTLYHMYLDLKKRHHAERYAILMDARRMEVYMSIYDSNENCLLDSAPVIMDESKTNELFDNSKWCFGGNGVDKCLPLIKNVITDFSSEINLIPSSKNMVEPAYHAYLNKTFEDIAYFEPAYLKPFFGTTPKP